MKVILTDDIKSLGNRGETVNVAAGFARNFLLPKEMALEATPGNLKRIEQQKRRYDARLAKEKDQAETIARQVEGLSLVLRKKAGDQNALYGSVTAAELAVALAEKGYTVDKRKIEIEEPIKRLGKHTVHVKLHRDVSVSVAVDVQPL